MLDTSPAKRPPRAHMVGYRTGSTPRSTGTNYPRADWVTIDHRRGTPFESGNMTASIRAMWDLTPDLNIHIEAVHRLNNFRSGHNPHRVMGRRKRASTPSGGQSTS